MYNKPVKEKGIKKKSEDGEPIVEEIPTFIENAEQYDNFTKHPDTVKIFTTDESYVGESTFSGIFVNAVPEKTKYMGQVAKTVVLGFTIATSDLVVSKIVLEKILKFIPSTTSENAGSKNEIVVDIRIGFTESQAKMIYYSVGDIFAELGGLSASVKLVLGSTATLLVLSYVFDL